MDKENVPPMMDGSEMIEYIGISKRLGNNVLQELEQRASNLMPGVSPGNKVGITGPAGSESKLKQSLSMKFQDTHEKRFQVMDSIATHYSLAKYGAKSNSDPVDELLDEPATVLTPEVQETPGKRSYSEEDQEKAEVSLKDSLKKQKPTPQIPFSPVTDITHRIRRLRVRIGTGGSSNRSERDRRRNIVGNTPLTEQRQIYDSLDVPTFALPTETSLKHKQMNSPIHKLSGLQERSIDKSNIKPATRTTTKHGDIFRNLAKKQADQKKTEISVQKAAVQPAVDHIKRLPSSKSVFERLYEQSTISRSNSSKNLEKTMSPNKTIPRSKTNHDLHRASNLKTSTTLQSVSLNRPQWR